MKVMLVPVGEQLDPIYEGFKHVKDIDVVFVIASKKTEKNAMQIINDLKRIYKFKYIDTSPENLDMVVEAILANLKPFKKVEVVSNLSGGTKIMSLACYILTSLLDGSAFYIFKEDSGEMTFVEVPMLKIDLGDIITKNGRQFKILQILSEDKNLSLSEISEKIKLKAPTTHAHIVSLKKKNLVEVIRGSEEQNDCRKVRVALTKTGKIVYAILSNMGN